jgi:hypothetical protein
MPARFTVNKNGQAVEGNTEDLLDALYQMGGALMQEHQAVIDRAIEQCAAKVKFGTPGRADIEVRREGLRRRENPADRRRYEALKANRDRAILTARHLNDLGGFAASGQQYVMEVIEHLTDMSKDFPEDLQPISEALTKASAKILTGSYAECLKFLAEMGFLEIAEATPPGQQDTQSRGYV